MLQTLLSGRSHQDQASVQLHLQKLIAGGSQTLAGYLSTALLLYFNQWVPISQRASFVSFAAAVVGYSDKSNFRLKEFVITHNSTVPCVQGSHDGWSLTEQATRPSQSRAQSNDLMHG